MATITWKTSSGETFGVIECADDPEVVKEEISKAFEYSIYKGNNWRTFGESGDTITVEFND